MITAIDVALKAERRKGQITPSTQILSQLEDTSLVSRTQLVRTPTERRRDPVTPRPQSAPKSRRPIPVWMTAMAGVLITAVFLFFLSRVFSGGTGDEITVVTETAVVISSVTHTVKAVMVETKTAVSTYTPTPIHTPTPLPTPIPSQIGYYISDTDQHPITLADPIESGNENVQLLWWLLNSSTDSDPTKPCYFSPFWL